MHTMRRAVIKETNCSGRAVMTLWVQEESLATDDDSAVLFDVSSQQNIWPDDSHSVSSSLNQVYTPTSNIPTIAYLDHIALPYLCLRA